MARIIKRYENRKLYDTEAKGYVSLEEIAGMVRQGIDIQVIDKASGTDLTAQTLTQVILEESKKGRNPLSTEVLHDVLRWSNNFIEDGFNQVRRTFDQFVPPTLNAIFKKEEDAENIELLRQKVESLEALILQLSQQAAASTEDDVSETDRESS